MLSNEISNRDIRFLNESNKIEKIYEIDYNDPSYKKLDKGHFGAFILSQNRAKNYEPLTIPEIKKWQKLITEEQVLHNHHIEQKEIGHIRGPLLQKNVRVGPHIPPHFSHVPTLLDSLVEEINESLKKNNFRDDVEFCKFLGSSFQKFEAIHPFADGNGRVGRLIANYIAAYCRRPIIVFESEMTERNEFYRAHDSEKKMWCFMAKKIQEAVFGTDGQILRRKRINQAQLQFMKSIPIIVTLFNGIN